jgi:hypothetical protein
VPHPGPGRGSAGRRVDAAGLVDALDELLGLGLAAGAVVLMLWGAAPATSYLFPGGLDLIPLI